MAVPPDPTPVIAPVPAVAVATLVFPLFQAPVGEVSLRVVVEPAQTFLVPVISAGSGLTVNGVVAMQLVARV